MRNNKGFSLVELIVVIAIMAILAAVAIPTFATFIGKAQKASDVDFMAQAQSAAELAFATETAPVNGIKVTIDDNAITTIVVTVGTKDYTFGKENGALKCTTSGLTTTETKCAEDFAAVVDASYEFKSEKDGTFKVNADGSALESAN